MHMHIYDMYVQIGVGVIGQHANQQHLTTNNIMWRWKTYYQ